ncbi:UNVERIFIED_CONTAM: hypothetical protein NCL1_30877 [Trichonephila clavipes]
MCKMSRSSIITMSYDQKPYKHAEFALFEYLSYQILTITNVVSWIRRTDFHVLTVGIETYTSDERFEALHLQKNNDWTLQIKYTQLRDSGTYECQVSSDPKISFFVNLTIVEADVSFDFQYSDRKQRKRFTTYRNQHGIELTEFVTYFSTSN